MHVASVILLCLLFGISACQPSATTPQLLQRIQATELDPLCFYTTLIEGDSSEISAQNCAEDVVKGEQQKGDDGSFTSYFSEPEFLSTGNYITYRPIGLLENELLVAVHWNGGGTGHFSTLLRLVEQANKVVISNSYLLGDRCNGGLVNVEIRDGQVVYSTALTRYAMLQVTEHQDDSIDRSMIDGSAAGCFAQADFRDDHFLGVTLPEEFQTNLDNYRVSETDNPEQYCFDMLMLLNFTHGNTFFSRDDLPTIIREIEHTCLGASESLE